MPRDWKNDPAAVQRYCSCRWIPTPEDHPRAVRWPGDGHTYKRIGYRKGCPLHDPDERFDLPDGVL